MADTALVKPASGAILPLRGASASVRATFLANS